MCWKQAASYITEVGKDDPSGMPAEYWSKRLANRMVELVSDGSLPCIGRTALLRLMGARSAESAGHLAKDLLKCGEPALRMAALDVLPALEPDEAIPVLQNECKEGARDILIEMRSLYGGHGGRHPLATGLKDWHTEALLDILFATFPPSSDPDRIHGRAYTVGVEDQLRDAGRNLTASLLQAGTAAAEAALERLGQRHGLIADLVKHRDAETAATVLLSRPERQRLPVEKVVHAIESADYRAIRTDEDLLKALLEVLEQIGRTAKKHLAMLYRPKEPGRRRERLHEDALQAYLRCRLSDMLADRVLDRATRVTVNREIVEAYDKRLDVKVQAPKLTGGFATVVIEVKWSDNDTISTALREQLGDYLGDNNFTQGIYMVGWSGKLGRWPDEAGPRPEKTKDALGSALEQQASVFAAENPGMCIRSLVMDLSWPA